MTNEDTKIIDTFIKEHPELLFVDRDDDSIIVLEDDKHWRYIVEYDDDENKHLVRGAEHVACDECMEWHPIDDQHECEKEDASITLSDEEEEENDDDDDDENIQELYHLDYMDMILHEVELTNKLLKVVVLSMSVLILLNALR